MIDMSDGDNKGSTVKGSHAWRGTCWSDCRRQTVIVQMSHAALNHSRCELCWLDESVMSGWQWTISNVWNGHVMIGHRAPTCMRIWLSSEHWCL